MRHVSRLAAVAAVLFLVGHASAQSVNFNFADGTSDGWDSGGFSDSTAVAVATIGGTNYISLPIGGFQVANVATGNTSSALFEAMIAAATNPSGYDLSYNYYIDTSTFTGATINSYLQLGTFVNGGDGAYHQDFPATPEVQLSGAQLTSGQVFTGSVSVNFAATGLVLPTTETYVRLGLIENSDSGPAYVVDFTNIAISPVAVPEPASLSLLALGLSALGIRPRRRAA